VGRYHCAYLQVFVIIYFQDLIDGVSLPKKAFAAEAVSTIWKVGNGGSCVARRNFQVKTSKSVRLLYPVLFSRVSP